MKRVVITGMGIYSCIGKNLDEVKDSLYHGKSGIGIDPVRKELGYFSALTGILQRPDLKKLLDRRKRLCLPEQGEYAYLATLEAFRNAGINEDFSKPTKWVSCMAMIVAPLLLLTQWTSFVKRKTLPWWVPVLFSSR